MFHEDGRTNHFSLNWLLWNSCQLRQRWPGNSTLAALQMQSLTFCNSAGLAKIVSLHSDSCADRSSQVRSWVIIWDWWPKNVHSLSGSAMDLLQEPRKSHLVRLWIQDIICGIFPSPALQFVELQALWPTSSHCISGEERCLLTLRVTADIFRGHQLEKRCPDPEVWEGHCWAKSSSIGKTQYQKCYIAAAFAVELNEGSNQFVL